MKSMNARNHYSPVRRQRGQTLVIALIVLGVLLILGFVFLGLIDKNIKAAGQVQSRSVAGDLAEAGIRYAHSQLLTDELGADWRGKTVSLTGNVSTDPDLYYIRPGTGMRLRSGTDPIIDMGGPDGLGPFIRVNFSTGRALVRVRYAPSDFNLFTTSPVGALRNPGQAKNLLEIEAVGRPGLVLSNDPTTQNHTGGIQYTGFGGNQALFEQSLQQMRQAETQIQTSRKLIAFNAIGITEQALFITNLFNVNRPAEIGVPPHLGATYFDSLTNQAYEVGPQAAYPSAVSGAGGLGLAMLVGGMLPLPNQQGVANAKFATGGGIRSNADLKLYGPVNVFLNQAFGEGVYVSGAIIPDTGAKLVVNETTKDGNGNWLTKTQQVLQGLAIDSRSSSFTTDGGVIRDGYGAPDQAGYPRAVGKLAPPSALVVDPATNVNRYVESTRDSGALVNGVNTGRFGHGQGVYVDNFTDRQNPSDEAGLQNVGDQESLIYDWLNPNNAQANSGWRGSFYVPSGAYVQLLPDGFAIERRSGEWKDYFGAGTASVMRYRVGQGSDLKLHIVDTTTPNVSINGQLQQSDYDKGFPFNGVLYFEGNVRIRGWIPTDVQLTVVSNATIYVEGSIQKGVTENDWTFRTDSKNPGDRITHAPKATLMLMAKDYVTINPTMFFAPAPGQLLKSLQDVPTDVTYKPVTIISGDPDYGALQFATDFALDSANAADPTNPSTWYPYAVEYFDAATPTVPITTGLTLVHASDNGPAPTSLVQLLVNYAGNTAGAQYQFPVTSLSPTLLTPYISNSQFNSAAGLTTPPYGAWGLGAETWQRYTKFEAVDFPLVGTGPSAVSSSGNTMSAAAGFGSFSLFTTGSNEFMLKPAPFEGQANNDYLLARAAIIPNDVKIEASMYAEQGAFFVIPGSWMNPNPSDRHDLYTSLGTNPSEQQIARLESFGANPDFPFYGEPCDVKIQIIGAISENMPVPISQQAQYLQKWGWIPRQRGASGISLAGQHVPSGYDITRDMYVPNLTISYDPVLATATNNGYLPGSTPNANVIRTDEIGRVLPPIPRLPVSPALAYFGEIG